MRGVLEGVYSVAAVVLVLYGVMSLVAYTAKRAGTMTADGGISPNMPAGFERGQLLVPAFVLRVLRPVRWPIALVGTLAVIVRVLV